MTTYFSTKTLGFYDDRIRSGYEENGTWPEDAKEVSDEIFATYMAAPADGKQLGSDDAGFPAWVDAPPLSEAEKRSQAEYYKSIKINIANNFINDRQWPSKLALGRISESDKGRFIEWLDYLDALERVDTTDTKEIVWPEIPS